MSLDTETTIRAIYNHLEDHHIPSTDVLSMQDSDGNDLGQFLSTIGVLSTADRLKGGWVIVRSQNGEQICRVRYVDESTYEVTA